MRKIYLYVAMFILMLNAANAQIALRGMYIDGFNTILGNTVKEDSLLHYAQDSSFNYLALYSLHQVNLSNPSTANTMAAFIYKARVTYGITYVGAICETYSGFRDRIGPYNLSRTDDNERFNVFNMEFEFWTQSSVGAGGYYCTQYLQQANCSCDTSGGFQYFISQMRQIDSLAATQSVISETYLGWFNQGQAQQIANNADRILLHAYRTGTSSLYSYSATRLQYLASNNATVQVAPIFSAEPVFMGPWLDSHAQIEAYNQYLNDFNASSNSWKQYINLLGFQWFDWGFMPKPVQGSGGFNPTITASGPLNICTGSSVTLTASSGSSYLWSNGANTQSITTTSGGTFSCSVTLNGNTQSTPAVTINVVNYPTVTISQGTILPSQVTLNSSTTAGSGGVATYQWKLNNNDISGANSSSHTAINSGTYKLTIANSYGCSTTSNALSITLAACSPTVPTGLSSTAVTELTQNLSWNSIASADSIIVRYHPDASPSYTYIRMSNTGQTSTTISNLDPNTLYSWRVKTICGSTESNYSSISYFTTGNNTNGLHEIPQVKDGDGGTGNTISGFRVYPNPSTELINLEFDATQPGEGEIRITDLNGRETLKQNVAVTTGHNKSTLKISGYSSGIYFLNIRNNDKVFFQKLFVGH